MSASPVPPLTRTVRLVLRVCATRQYLALPVAPEIEVTATPLLRYGSPPPPPVAEYVPVNVTPEYAAYVRSPTQYVPALGGVNEQFSVLPFTYGRHWYTVVIGLLPNWT